MDKEVKFNAKHFWQSISTKRCKKKLRGALVYLQREMKKGSITEDMIACKVFLEGKVGKMEDWK